MCVDQATKNVLVNDSPEPSGIHWDRKLANKWKVRNETYLNIIKLKHVQNGKSAIVCKNQKTILCVARQVIQSANCASARRLKNVLMDQLGILS